MPNRPWTDHFEALVREHLPLLEQDQPLEPDLIVGDHGLDSMAAVSLLLEIEQQYKVVVPDEDLPKVLDSDVQGLWEIVCRTGVPDPSDQPA